MVHPQITNAVAAPGRKLAAAICAQRLRLLPSCRNAAQRKKESMAMQSAIANEKFAQIDSPRQTEAQAQPRCGSRSSGPARIVLTITAIAARRKPTARL